ncbi:DUF262 domain-containing protein [Mycoplasmopsis canis]|uniref:DUF262 domain-containing protein n=1 Tax=Mycoplasmopsis canis TaxID=29555 RepID=UPI00025AF9EE|nr:DUF262 domain-containing protein [Mycoplasmopsis canis]EIE40295.1 hypothetical protein MCANUF33_02266 [Mycoplasmopsis canis UF33]
MEKNNEYSKYEIKTKKVSNIISWEDDKSISVPEIQRPFVWKTSQVRDLIESLYNGYPIGYIIISNSKGIRKRDGELSKNEKLLIDGQQRITSIWAALLKVPTIDKYYKEKTITISFNPRKEKFETLNPAIEKDKEWISDISIFFKKDAQSDKFIKEYIENNKDKDDDENKKWLTESYLSKIWTKMIQINNREIGVIELDEDLDIDTITDIFIKINSKGTRLNQTDYALSKISANTKYNGNNIRKMIDISAKLIIEKESYKEIFNKDKDFFSEKELGHYLRWMKDSEITEIYKPDYEDILRVSFTYKFKRGKINDLVNLLSGKNLLTKDIGKEEIAKISFETLEEGLKGFVNKYNLDNFNKTIMEIGFKFDALIKSKHNINFAYILFLLLREKKMDMGLIQKYVRKWFVMSLITKRYSSSLESKFDKDVKEINEEGVDKVLQRIEETELSDIFWDKQVPEELKTTNSISSIFLLYLAIQIKEIDIALFSKHAKIVDIFKKGDIHHLFPKDYLSKNKIEKNLYNQIANYVYIEKEINNKISNKSPKEYFNFFKLEALKEQIKQSCSLGAIQDDNLELEELEKQVKQNCGVQAIHDYNLELEKWKKQMEQNCIPEEIQNYDFNNYKDFLEQRRKLMAKKIKEFYRKL